MTRRSRTSCSTTRRRPPDRVDRLPVRRRGRRGEHLRLRGPHAGRWAGGLDDAPGRGRARRAGRHEAGPAPGGHDVKIIPENVEALIRGRPRAGPDRVGRLPRGIEIEKGSTFRCLVRFDDGTQTKVAIVQRDDRRNVEIKPYPRQPLGRAAPRAPAGSRAASAWPARSHGRPARSGSICGKSRARGSRCRSGRSRRSAARATAFRRRASSSTRSSLSGSSARSWRTRSSVAPTAFANRRDERHVGPRLERRAPAGPRVAPSIRALRAARVSAQRKMRRGTGCSSASPQRSASSTRARASASAGIEAGSGLSRSSSRAIASDFSTRRPSIFSTGTVLPRKPASAYERGMEAGREHRDAVLDPLVLEHQARRHAQGATA